MRRQNHVRVLGARTASAEVLSDVSSSSDDIDARSDDGSTPKTARSEEDKVTPRFLEQHRLSMKHTKSASQPTLVPVKSKSSSSSSSSKSRKKAKRTVSDDTLQSEPRTQSANENKDSDKKSPESPTQSPAREVRGEKEMLSSNAVVAALQARRREKEREAREQGSPSRSSSKSAQ